MRRQEGTNLLQFLQSNFLWSGSPVSSAGGNKLPRLPPNHTCLCCNYRKPRNPAFISNPGLFFYIRWLISPGRNKCDSAVLLQVLWMLCRRSCKLFVINSMLILHLSLQSAVFVDTCWNFSVLLPFLPYIKDISTLSEFNSSGCCVKLLDMIDLFSCLCDDSFVVLFLTVFSSGGRTIPCRRCLLIPLPISIRVKSACGALRRALQRLSEECGLTDLMHISCSVTNTVFNRLEEWYTQPVTVLL